MHGPYFCSGVASAEQAPVRAQVVKRTINVDFEIPAQTRISPQCRDLLLHLLVKEPEKRYGITDILGHSWFLAGLPRGWERLNPDCMAMRVCAICISCIGMSRA